MSLIDRVRQKILERGSSSIKGIGRTFRLMDDDGSWNITREEFMKGLKDYGLEISDEELNELCITFDKDGSGTINFDEFVIALRGSLKGSRLKVVEQAFQKIDKTGDGVATTADLKGVYKVTDHPKYKNGEWSQEEVFTEFLKSFEVGDKDGKVTKDEFINYYAGLSASIDEDAYFDLMIRNSWKI